ncbi:unnamed protein product [Citrullus colocynthis]|uniref:Uncharacterized protein n=1 Tax=Citrullus colocynthis TaxID=252529 RepID=A0ABP0ZBI6_9ROSI
MKLGLNLSNQMVVRGKDLDDFAEFADAKSHIPNEIERVIYSMSRGIFGRGRPKPSFTSAIRFHCPLQEAIIDRLSSTQHLMGRIQISNLESHVASHVATRMSDLGVFLIEAVIICNPTAAAC